MKKPPTQFIQAPGIADTAKVNDVSIEHNPEHYRSRKIATNKLEKLAKTHGLPLTFFIDLYRQSPLAELEEAVVFWETTVARLKQNLQERRLMTDLISSFSVVSPKPKAKKDKPIGNPVSPTTIQKYHRLAKTTTMSANQIQKQLHTTTNSYYTYCEKYTNEESIDMIGRAKLIRNKNWLSKSSDGVME